MAGTDRLYPMIEPYDLEPLQFGAAAAAAAAAGYAMVCDRLVRWDEEPEAGTHIFEQETKDHPDISSTAGNLGVGNVYECSGEMSTIKESGENIYYDCPLREQTGIWVPPSVPPMTKHDHEEWQKGFVSSNGGYFPEKEYKWDIDEKNKEMTMWDVLAEMVVAGKDKVLSIASYDFGRHSMSLISHFLLQEALNDKAEALADASEF